jgi:hypothetical protein
MLCLRLRPYLIALQNLPTKAVFGHMSLFFQVLYPLRSAFQTFLQKLLILYPTFSEIDPAKLGPNFAGQKLTTKVANFVNSFCESVRSAFGGVRKS